MRVNKNESIYGYLLNNNPELLEDDFFNASTTIVADNAVYAPTYADYKAKRTGGAVQVSDNYDMLGAGGLPQRMATELIRKMQLNAAGDLYFAPVLRSAITPASGQKFTFIFHFYIL